MSKIYEVGIDLGEMGTQTIATFDDMALAMAFLDGYKLADATSNVFIDTATSDFLESVFEDTDFEGMINALHIAMDEIDHSYNHEPDEQMRENYTISYTQLSKIETILINLQNGEVRIN